MENVNRIVALGVCVGCGACDVCPHIHMKQGPLGFPVPRADENCTRCGKCVAVCAFDPFLEDD